MCMLPVWISPVGSVVGPPGDHHVGVSLHERPVLLRELFQKRPGSRFVAAVEEVAHGADYQAWIKDYVGDDETTDAVALTEAGGRCFVAHLAGYVL